MAKLPSLLAILIVTACAPIVPPPTPLARVNVSLPIHPNTAGLDALLQGPLYAEDGCLFVGGPGGPLTGVAWPAGTRWDPARNTIISFGVEASLGDVVQIGGGHIDVDVEKIRRMPWITPPRPECLGDAFWFASGLIQEVATPTDEGIPDRP